MASPSQVDRALDEIAMKIRDQRMVMTKVKSNAASASTALDSIPGEYEGELQTINGYDAPGGELHRPDRAGAGEGEAG